tara:strand:+ start:1686 stop:2105 length:420 start_codon:yes stop_codon:yes gene_type:complete
MAFPTQQIVTTNLDSSSDSPASARADLLSAVTALNTIISEGNGANGVAVLNGDGRLNGAQMPQAITPAGGLTLSPANKIVTVDRVLRMTPLNVTQVNLLTATEGDVVYVENGAAGGKCIAVYNGTDWKVVALGSTISAT